jgi:hypothetical protein
VVGSWNGGPYTTIGVFRAGLFYLKVQNLPGPADLAFAYGAKGDVPVMGDWNGDRVSTPGLVRVSL